MKGFKCLGAALAVLSFLGPGFAQAATCPRLIRGPSPDQLQILSATAFGSGCPSGTAQVFVSATTPGGPADLLEVIFSNFRVSKIPDSKNCLVRVQMKVPAGFRFSLADVYYEGYADILAGDKGLLTSEYWFPPFNVDKATTVKTMNGAFKGNYSKQDTLGILTWVFPPSCQVQVPLYMNSTLALQGRAGDPALLTVNLLTGYLRQKWGLVWCGC